MAGDGFYAFERFREDCEPDSDAFASVITAVNCGAHEHHLALEGHWTDLLTELTHDGTVTLRPGGAVLLEKSSE